MVIARFAASAMATRFELVLEGDQESRLRGISEEVFEEIHHWENTWSLFLKESVIARVNREAHAHPVVLDSQTYSLLEEALQISRASQGAFDPTLGSLMERFGFRDSRGDADEPRWGAEGVVLEAPTRRVSFRVEGLRLDLGGIAKGRALDLAVDVLRDHGIECALLHGGTSSVYGLGAPSGSDGWHVALDGEPGAPVALLRDCALSVSCTAGRRAEAGSHLIDGLAGEPCATPGQTAVVAPASSTADAWATALTVAGDRELTLPPDLQALRRRASDGADWQALSPSSTRFRLQGATACEPAIRT